MIKQYRKKPVVIEAIQWNEKELMLLNEFVSDSLLIVANNVIIRTLEGDMKVNNGDYIIKGVKGEFYACKPDIFEQTYEECM